VLVGGGANCLGYTGQSLFLPNWFVRRRGLAMSVAFSGVGVGSMLVLPWVQAMIGRVGWRAACETLGLLVLALLAPLNLLLQQRPEDLGLEPDGDRSVRTSAASGPTANVVDAAWVAVDWTLSRAMRTARFWWIAAGYWCGLFAWYAVQVHQTKYLVEIGVSAPHAAWALGSVSLAGASLAKSRLAMSPTASGANGCGPWVVWVSPSVIWPYWASATDRRRRCSRS
jgi:sugar phosphate permease